MYPDVRIIGALRKNKMIGRLFLSGADARTTKTRNNIVYSSIFRGVGMVAGLVMIPIALNYLNPTKYGVWLILSSLIAWVNFFDIGLGNGLRNKLAEALASQDFVRARTYVSTTYAILTIIISALLVSFFFVNQFINWFKVLNVPPSFNEDLGLLIVVVFFFFALRFVLGLIVTILTADQRTGTAGLLDVVISVLSLLGVYLISRRNDGSLLLLGCVLSLVPAAVLLIANLWFFQKDYKLIRPSFRFIKLSLAKDLMQLSFRFFLLQACAMLIFFSNNIIIAHLLNPAKVSEFNIVFRYFNVITVLSVLILNPFWSAATEAYFKQDFDWLKKSSSRLLKVWGIIAIITFFMILVSPFVYKLWIKDALNISFGTSLLMGIYVVVLALHNNYVFLINGIGKIGLQLRIYLVIALFVIPLSYLFIKIFNLGINGSVLCLIVCALPATILIPKQFHLIVNRKAKGIFNK
jgi:O-antigen/teichoic acid export membrane protein